MVWIIQGATEIIHTMRRGGTPKKSAGRNRMRMLFYEKRNKKVLEEYRGMQYGGEVWKLFPCFSLEQARVIAKREIGGNEDRSAMWSKKMKRIYIKRNALTYHPSVKKGKRNKDVVMFFVSGTEKHHNTPT